MSLKSVIYDAKIIREFASRLYEKADSVVISSTLGGTVLYGLIGGIAGAFLGRYFKVDPVGAMQLLAVLAALVGGIRGYLDGKERAFKFRLDAQMALCQLQIEQNTASNDGA